MTWRTSAPMSGTCSPSSTDPSRLPGLVVTTLPVDERGQPTHNASSHSILEWQGRPPCGPAAASACTGAVHRRFVRTSVFVFAYRSGSSAVAMLPTAAAPTNVGSAVQYTVPSARQNGSECLPVDCAVLRGLLVYAAFNGTLGFPGEGRPKKRFVCCFVISCSD